MARQILSRSFYGSKAKYLEQALFVSLFQGEKRKCDGNSECVSSFLLDLQRQVFRYYMMVRSLGRPHHGGKILDTDIFSWRYQPTFEAVFSATDFDNTVQMLVASDFHTI